MVRASRNRLGDRQMQICVSVERKSVLLHQYVEHSQGIGKPSTPSSPGPLALLLEMHDRSPSTTQVRPPDTPSMDHAGPPTGWVELRWSYGTRCPPRQPSHPERWRSCRETHQLRWWPRRPPGIVQTGLVDQGRALGPDEPELMGPACCRFSGLPSLHARDGTVEYCRYRRRLRSMVSQQGRGPGGMGGN